MVPNDQNLIHIGYLNCSENISNAFMIVQTSNDDLWSKRDSVCTPNLIKIASPYPLPLKRSIKTAILAKFGIPTESILDLKSSKKAWTIIKTFEIFSKQYQISNVNEIWSFGTIWTTFGKKGERTRILEGVKKVPPTLKKCKNGHFCEKRKKSQNSQMFKCE